MIVPYAVDIPMERWPIANFAILGLIVVCFGFEMSGSGEVLGSMVLYGWTVSGLLGHMWLHAGIFHLLGNGIFLWVFGNAVCAKLGNKVYPAVYVGLGLTAAIVYLLFFDLPMIGASGAINGIIGMCLVLYPLNEVSCFYWIVIRPGTFRVSSYWMILLWFAFDILGAAMGGSRVAYVAHLGGFAAGFALAFLLVRTGRVVMDQGERSLLHVLGWMPKPPADTAGERTGLHHRGHGLEDVSDESLRIPAIAGREDPVPPTPPHAPAPARTASRVPSGSGSSAQFISFECTCGHRMKTYLRNAGRKARCPACSATIEVPLA